MNTDKFTDEQMQMLRLLGGPTHPTDALDAATAKALWVKLEEQISRAVTLRLENAELREALRRAEAFIRSGGDREGPVLRHIAAALAKGPAR